MRLSPPNFLGRNQRPPNNNEINKNTTDTHEKTVLSVAIPITRNAIPKISKYPETLRLLKFITTHFQRIEITSENGLVPSNNSEGLPLNVISKKSIKYAFTISVTRFPFNGPFNPSCGAIGENNGRSLKS